jgi:hypothetical protein
MTIQIETLQMEETYNKTSDKKWCSLHKAAGAAALISAVFFPIQIIIFFISPPPSSIIGWFTLFQTHKLFGLLDLDLLLMADEVLVILIFLALYVALRQASESLMAIGTALGLASAVLFITPNPAFAMLSLSDQYAAAGTEAQKAMYLAAGQVMITNWQGSAFQVAYFLGSLAPILISLIMLRTKLFNKATAYMGILANGLALGLYVPRIGVYISIFSVVFLLAWYVLLARGFFRLGRVDADTIN